MQEIGTTFGNFPAIHFSFWASLVKQLSTCIKYFQKYYLCQGSFRNNLSLHSNVNSSRTNSSGILNDRIHIQEHHIDIADEILQFHRHVREKLVDDVLLSRHHVERFEQRHVEGVNSTNHPFSEVESTMERRGVISVKNRMGWIAHGVLEQGMPIHGGSQDSGAVVDLTKSQKLRVVRFDEDHVEVVIVPFMDQVLHLWIGQLFFSSIRIDLVENVVPIPHVQYVLSGLADLVLVGDYIEGVAGVDLRQVDQGGVLVGDGGHQGNMVTPQGQLLPYLRERYLVAVEGRRHQRQDIPACRERQERQDAQRTPPHVTRSNDRTV